jgi:hypothetical protein
MQETLSTINDVGFEASKYTPFVCVVTIEFFFFNLT